MRKREYIMPITIVMGMSVEHSLLTLSNGDHEDYTPGDDILDPDEQP